MGFVLLQTTIPLMPVWVLLGGFVLTGIARVFGAYYTRSNNRKLFINNIRSLANSLPGEIVSLERRVASLAPEAGERGIYPMPTLFQLNVFRDMTYRAVFDAFFTGIENYFFWSKDSSAEQEKLTDFNRMWAVVNSLENYKKVIEAGWENRGKEAEKALAEFTDELETLHGVISPFLKKHLNPEGLTPKQKEYSEEIFSVLDEYYKKEAPKFAGATHIFKNLIQPIKEINPRYYDGIDEDVMLMVRAISKAEKKYQTFANVLEFEIDQTKSLISALRKIETALPSIIARLS